jgi:hypothetical protein
VEEEEENGEVGSEGSWQGRKEGLREGGREIGGRGRGGRGWGVESACLCACVCVRVCACACVRFLRVRVCLCASQGRQVRYLQRLLVHGTLCPSHHSCPSHPCSSLPYPSRLCPSLLGLMTQAEELFPSLCCGAVAFQGIPVRGMSVLLMSVRVGSAVSVRVVSPRTGVKVGAFRVRLASFAWRVDDA